MKNLLRVIAVTAVAGLSIVPTLAAAAGMDPAKMTCAEFSAMDSAGMMTAVGDLHKASPDAAMAMDDEAMKMATETTMAGCKDHPDMMAMDAMMKK